MYLEYFKNKWEERIKILKNAREYVKRIKEICVNEIDKNCRVILFGSVVKGNYRIDSDIDVLIILPKIKDIFERAEIAAKIYKKLGIEDPIELHIISEEEYKNWYSKFIDKYEEY